MVEIKPLPLENGAGGWKGGRNSFAFSQAIATRRLLWQTREPQTEVGESSNAQIRLLDESWQPDALSEYLVTDPLLGIFFWVI